MFRAEEHLVEIYNSLPSVEAFSDLMQNVRTLINKGLDAKQAMSASYAVAEYNPDLEEDAKESFKKLMRQEEIEEAQKYAEILRALEDDELTEETSSFYARFGVNLQRSRVFQPGVAPEDLPIEWSAIIYEVSFPSDKNPETNKYERDKFKRTLKKGNVDLSGKGETSAEALKDLATKLTSKGLQGELKIRNLETGKTNLIDLSPETEPEKEPVAVETHQVIRRPTVDNGSEYLKALEELDALTGRVKKLAESQRPAVKDVISAMEADLKQAVLVRLAETFRSLGYENWPTDPEGQKDIENVMDSVSGELDDMGKRVNEMFKSEVAALKKSGEKTYKENLNRWLAGQTMIDEEPEKPEADKDGGEEEMDEKKKKAKLSKEAQDFISAEISKNMKDGMPQDQAIAAAYSAAREKGYEVPKNPKKKSEEEEEECSPDQADPNEPPPINEPKMESRGKKSR